MTSGTSDEKWVTPLGVKNTIKTESNKLYIDNKKYSLIRESYKLPTYETPLIPSLTPTSSGLFAVNVGSAIVYGSHSNMSSSFFVGSTSGTDIPKPVTGLTGAIICAVPTAGFSSNIALIATSDSLLLVEFKITGAHVIHSAISQVTPNTVYLNSFVQIGEKWLLTKLSETQYIAISMNYTNKYELLSVSGLSSYSGIGVLADYLIAIKQGPTTNTITLYYKNFSSSQSGTNTVTVAGSSGVINAPHLYFTDKTNKYLHGFYIDNNNIYRSLTITAITSAQTNGMPINSAIAGLNSAAYNYKTGRVAFTAVSNKIVETYVIGPSGFTSHHALMLGNNITGIQVDPVSVGNNHIICVIRASGIARLVDLDCGSGAVAYLYYHPWIQYGNNTVTLPTSNVLYTSTTSDALLPVLLTSSQSSTTAGTLVVYNLITTRVNVASTT